jgi:transcriptional regulator with XRE-family HTH domain
MTESSVHIKVGKRIQEIRASKGISQQVLAAKCNFEKGNMSRIESGRVNITLSTMHRISTALEVELLELFKF